MRWRVCRKIDTTKPSLVKMVSSMFAWASLPPACRQSAYHMLFWLHHSNAPHAQTSEAFSLSKWGRGPQAEALPVARLTLPWPHPLAWYCRSVFCFCFWQSGKFVMVCAKKYKIIKFCMFSSVFIHLHYVVWRSVKLTFSIKCISCQVLYSMKQSFGVEFLGWSIGLKWISRFTWNVMHYGPKM